MSEGTLRPIEENDLTLVRAWRNAERVRRWMFTDHEISEAEHRAWFQKLSFDATRKTWIYEEAGRPLGVVNVTGIDHGKGACSWGFYLGEDNLPPGTGSAMGAAALKKIFEQLGVTQVNGEAIATNDGSIAFHRKLGFSETGRRAGGAMKNGQPVDVVQFSILKRHWIARGQEHK